MPKGDVMANVHKTMSLQKLQSIDSPIYLIMCVHTHTNTRQNTETQNDI